VSRMLRYRSKCYSGADRSIPVILREPRSGVSKDERPGRWPLIFSRRAQERAPQDDGTGRIRPPRYTIPCAFRPSILPSS